jgi:ADP-ribose pyrophosphatase
MDAKRVFEGKHVVVLERGDWQFVERKKAKEAAAIIAETSDGRLILTEQFRQPVNARVIDWPAGLVGDEGEDRAAETARRELEEETGYRCRDVQLLVTAPTSPGITSELVHMFRTRAVEQHGTGGGVGREKIAVHAVPREEIVAWLKRRTEEGILVDMKVWAGLYFAMQST